MNYSTDQHASESAGWSDDPISIRAERRARYVDEQERRMRKFDEGHATLCPDADGIVRPPSGLRRVLIRRVVHSLSSRARDMSRRLS